MQGLTARRDGNIEENEMIRQLMTSAELAKALDLDPSKVMRIEIIAEPSRPVEVRVTLIAPTMLEQVLKAYVLAQRG